jgi:hypothetical protein
MPFGLQVSGTFAAEANDAPKTVANLSHDRKTFCRVFSRQ